MSPGQLGASPVGSLMFNQSVKQFFDGFRSRVTLIAQCLCFATAADANLWGPIAGGTRLRRRVCRVPAAVHVALLRRRRRRAAAGPAGDGAGDQTDADDAAASGPGTAQKRAGREADGLRGPVAGGGGGARDQRLDARSGREARDAKAMAKEADALTFVLDRIHEDFPPSKLDAMSEGESVETMRRVLAEIRAEMRAVSPDGKEEGARNDAETSETASNDANDANDAAGLDEASDARPKRARLTGKKRRRGKRRILKDAIPPGAPPSARARCR